MRFLKTYTGGARGSIGAALLVLALSAIALAGATGTGRAASSPAVGVDSFTVLNDDADKFQPTAGGNIGYDIHVTNGGTSVANHLSLTETIGTTGALAYVSATVNGLPAAICNTPGPSVSTLTCTLTKLDVGGTIDVIALFRTNPSASPGDPIQDTALLAFDSQTNGQANRKTTTYLSPPKAIAGLADGSLAQSVFLPGDDLPAFGAGQTSELAMPGGSFVNGFPYVGGSLQNGTCSGALPEVPGLRDRDHDSARVVVHELGAVLRRDDPKAVHVDPDAEAGSEWLQVHRRLPQRHAHPCVQRRQRTADHRRPLRLERRPDQAAD